MTRSPYRPALVAVLSVALATVGAAPSAFATTPTHVPMAAAASVTTLSPRTVPDGKLPSGYAHLMFVVSDGDWVASVSLPASPKDGSVVEVRSAATYDTTVQTPGLDFEVPSLTLKKGETFSFVYSASRSLWSLGGSSVRELAPNNTGAAAAIPEGSSRFTIYSLSNGKWAPKVSLPARATNGDQVMVQSTASTASAIAPDNLLYGSSAALRAGDSYRLMYISDAGTGLKGWAIVSAPTRDVTVAATVPSPTTPRTRMSLYNGGWVSAITLPASARDRDRVTIRSTATWASRIESTRVAAAGAMDLLAGDSYEFLYVAEKKKWIVQNSPDRTYNARDLGTGTLPKISAPRTIITFGDGNWVKTVTLPTGTPQGSRVVMKTDAAYDVTVNTGAGSVVIRKGETVAFVAGANGRWTRETVTIDLLLTYSDKAAAVYTAATMKSRLLEGLALTNEALENSGANFRYRSVALVEVHAAPEWKLLNDALSSLRTDTAVQGLRNQYKADGVYYEGTEEGCGLGYLRASASNMVATGSTSCDTTVMRHELGHNMGLNHGEGSDGSTSGNSMLSTIMSGNSIPFYATPDRYTPDAGIPLGIPGKIDSVRTMNNFSATVAAYR